LEHAPDVRGGWSALACLPPEADPTLVLGADLDVAEGVGRHEHGPALVVLELDELLSGRQRVGDGCTDLLGGVGRLERDLAGHVADADADLHGRSSLLGDGSTEPSLTRPPGGHDVARS